MFGSLSKIKMMLRNGYIFAHYINGTELICHINSIIILHEQIGRR